MGFGHFLSDLIEFLLGIRKTPSIWLKKGNPIFQNIHPCFMSCFFLLQNTELAYLSSDSDSEGSTESDESSSSQAEVTIRQLTKNKSSLYHLVAGKLDDDIHSNSNNTHSSVSTKIIRNTHLFEFITQRCFSDLECADVPEQKIKNLLQEGPSFVVTTSSPTPFDAQMTTIQPNINAESERYIYEYHHPDDHQMLIAIHEPRSPPRAVFQLSDTEAASAEMRTNEAVGVNA